MSVSLEEFDDTASVVNCGDIHGRVSFGGRRSCIRPSVQQELDHEYVSAFCCEVVSTCSLPVRSHRPRHPGQSAPGRSHRPWRQSAAVPSGRCASASSSPPTRRLLPIGSTAGSSKLQGGYSGAALIHAHPRCTLGMCLRIPARFLRISSRTPSGDGRAAERPAANGGMRGFVRASK